jgi:uncharacterized membrane protein
VGKHNKGKDLIPPNAGSGGGRPSASMARVEAYHFSGPLPPPDVLARYNEIVPQGAERIIAMAERQSAHREALEKKVVFGNSSSEKMGAIFAFILSLATILGGIWLIHDGKSSSGLVAILGNLAALAGVFVYSRRKQTKERVEKSDALAKRRDR